MRTRSSRRRRCPPLHAAGCLAQPSRLDMRRGVGDMWERTACAPRRSRPWRARLPQPAASVRPRHACLHQPAASITSASCVRHAWHPASAASVRQMAEAPYSMCDAQAEPAPCRGAAWRARGTGARRRRTRCCGGRCRARRCAWPRACARPRSRFCWTTRCAPHLARTATTPNVHVTLTLP